MKTLIFDWGGVITHIDPPAALKALQKLGIENAQEYFEPGPRVELFYQLEQGSVSPEEVSDQLNKANHTHIDHKLLENAYCRMLGDTPPIRIQLLRNLRPHFTLCLLSNTNIIHTRYYTGILRKEFHTDFSSLFHKLFYSYELGLRKPGSEIFKKVIEENRIDSKSAMFLDDTKTNIDTARSLGIPSIHINEDDTIEEIFHEWL